MQKNMFFLVHNCYGTLELALTLNSTKTLKLGRYVLCLAFWWFHFGYCLNLNVLGGPIYSNPCMAIPAHVVCPVENPRSAAYLKKKCIISFPYWYFIGIGLSLNVQSWGLGYFHECLNFINS